MESLGQALTKQNCFFFSFFFTALLQKGSDEREEFAIWKIDFSNRRRREDVDDDKDGFSLKNWNIAKKRKKRWVLRS